METFSALLAICAGNSPVTGEFPAQRPVMRSFDVYFDLCLNKRLIKQCEAGDLRRHRAHYDVIVIKQCQTTTKHNRGPYAQLLVRTITRPRGPDIEYLL